MDSSNMQCYCGKTFSHVNAFTNHQRHCKTSQRRLTVALSKAQQIWSKKRETQRLKRELEVQHDHTPELGGSSTTRLNIPSTPQRLTDSGEAAAFQPVLLGDNVDMAIPLDSPDMVRHLSAKYSFNVKSYLLGSGLRRPR